MSVFTLLGHPVSHSVSPDMHNAAAAELGLDYQYTATDVTPENLSGALERLRAGEWAGANITIPHKEATLPLLDELSETAATLGAVNTLIPVGERIRGENTDVPGFLAEIDSFEVELAGRPALIFGAGGSARAVAFGLLQRGAEVRILARNLSAGAQLARELHSTTKGRLLNFEWTPTDLGQAAQGCTLAVNCTPLGMTPEVHRTPWFPVVPFPEKIMLYDLVYNPPETMLVRQARSHGLCAAGGIGMLVQQGALAFLRWTGCQPPLDTMRIAAQKALHA